MELNKIEKDFLLQVLNQVTVAGKENMIMILNLIKRFEEEKK